jgi:hypothetical protein
MSAIRLECMVSFLFYLPLIAFLWDELLTKYNSVRHLWIDDTDRAAEEKYL